MKALLISCMLLIVLLPSDGSAGDVSWSAKMGERAALAGGSSLITRRCNGSETNSISYILFNEDKCELHVIAQGPLPENGKPLNEFIKSTGAFAGVNGGYFKAPKLIPSGLEISKGKPEGEPWRGNPLIATCLVRSGAIKLEWDAEWKGSDGVTELLQCSPWLVSDGATPKGISSPSSPRLRRTFIATDGLRNWVLGTCERMTLAGLASMLASQKVITELKITRAMNLDGGPSTGLWCLKSDQKVHYEREFWKVRNAIAINARP